MKIRSEEKGRRGNRECGKRNCSVKLCFSDSWISVLCAALLILFNQSCIVAVSGEKLHDDDYYYTANAMIPDVTFNSYISPSTFPTTSQIPTASPSLDICKDCNDYDLFDCKFLLQQTKQDANAICGFISREKSVKLYCKYMLIKKYTACLNSSNPTSHPTSTPTSIPSSHPTSTSHPTSIPTSHPTSNPTSHPTSHPTSIPSSHSNDIIYYII